MSRTPATTGNQKKWTFSAWVKPSRFGAQQPIFCAYSSPTNYGALTFSANGFFDASDTLKLYTTVANSTQCQFISNAYYRDPSAWYHVVVAIDTAQATDTDRVKIYVNGSQITSFSTAAYPAQNADIGFFNSSSYSQQIGALASSTYGAFDGYFSEVYFLDGNAQAPSAFGEINSTTGQWIPKQYSGSFGTTGFYLSFKDASAVNGAGTASGTYPNVTGITGIGGDTSGNNCHFTGSAGVQTFDQVIDSPANSFCVLNAVNAIYGYPNSALSSGGLKSTKYLHGIAVGTIAVESQKTYWEVTVSETNQFMGVISADTPGGATYSYSDSAAYGIYPWNNLSTIAGVTGSAGQGPYSATGAGTYMFAVDPTNNKMWAGKDGSWTGNPAAGTGNSFTLPANKHWLPWIHTCATIQANDAWVNFGQGGQTDLNYDANSGGRFKYTPPSGFKALCTANLSAPAITKPSLHFNSVLYDGTNAYPRSITGIGFRPDLLWVKDRTTAYDHVLVDSLRGATYGIHSNLTSGESTGWLSTFDTDGFTINNNNVRMNGPNPEKYVAWCWKAAATGVVNSDGSIPSQVAVNSTAKISIVTRTGDNTVGATVGHGLGTTPAMIISFQRSAGASRRVWHKGLPAGYNLLLDDAGAQWNGTDRIETVTSSTYSLQPSGTGGGINSTLNYVEYCFAEVPGFSRFGSYSGNSSTDGPFVWCGFKPRFILVKNITTAGTYWVILDSARDIQNPVNSNIFPNVLGAEGTGTYFVDFCTNGFKLRHSGSAMNISGSTHIFAAFAEAPFKYASAR